MDGLVTMTPSSIDRVGTSASINANGGVDFEGVTSLSLDGVFTGDYDNYLIVMAYKPAAGDVRTRLRFRNAGIDETGSNYVRQVLDVNGSNVLGVRNTENAATVGEMAATAAGGDCVHMYGPYLPKPSVMRNVNVDGYSSARLIDNACTHSLSTSYSGFTIYPEASNMTGNVIVMGYAE